MRLGGLQGDLLYAKDFALNSRAMAPILPRQSEADLVVPVGNSSRQRVGAFESVRRVVAVRAASGRCGSGRCGSVEKYNEFQRLISSVKGGDGGG